MIILTLLASEAGASVPNNILACRVIQPDCAVSSPRGVKFAASRLRSRNRYAAILRIPMKPAIDSDLKPASHSDFIPAGVPI
ncbi:hypothetical protein, partial [Mesorhizobium sp. M0698]|uniref:hypothetical protein n=1 Tax=Mesorhizobium sp. M0698 TaxID=2956987 RepID=UPI003338F2AE